VSSILDVRGLRKSIGGKVLLDGVTFSIADGEKVGVIGSNGSGKSTLLRIIAGLDGHEDGVIALRRGVGIGFLQQDPVIDSAFSILDIMREGPSLATEEEWERAHRIEELLTRVGLSSWDRRMGDLSGGEKRRVALARTLLDRPDLLLLDEPTNHLDAETVGWLEETLFDFAGAIAVITHDRYFLDRTVDRMLELSEGSVTQYEGGYTEYLEARLEREEREATEGAKRARFLETELAWARRSPPARTGKQKARQRRARDLAVEKREREEWRRPPLELEVGAVPRLGSRILELDGVGKSYGERPIIQDFSDRLLAGERIGIVGPNGVGKTTLLRLVIGDEDPDFGKVILGENTRIGYLDQNREIDPELSVEGAISENEWVEIGGKRIHRRAYLDRFLFPPHVQRQKVSSLSGGERNRLLLARLLLQESNLLILDEPTNDLDLDTLGLLEEMLVDFAGCILVVTHDRYLLDRIATSLWVFEGAGKVHRHQGGWDAYLARREESALESAEREREAERRRKKEREAEGMGWAQGVRAPKKGLSFGEGRELSEIDGKIAVLETERDAVAARLADPLFYQTAGGEVSDVTRRFQELEAELESLYRRWMELEEKQR
jgi:ATP-binding cassette subfamily F protein uup